MQKINLTKEMFLMGLFILSFLFFIGIFFLIEPYIHETGHIIFGFCDSLLKGNINTFTISNWNSHPYFDIIKTPQQVMITSGKGSLNFALGGPLFSIILFFALSLFGYLISKEKKWFLLFLSILLFEISGNVICGTDNLIGTSLSMCNHKLDLAIQLVAIFLFSSLWSYFIIKRLKYAKLIRYYNGNL